VTEKPELRRTIIKEMSLLPRRELETMSRAVLERLFSLSVWEKSQRIFCFRSLPGEVDTAGIIRRAVDEGKILALPRMDGENIVFHEITDPDEPLLADPRFGVHEPTVDKPISDPAVGPRPLILVPGLAYDQGGHRLGRGKGFYDRLLSSLLSRGVPFRSAGLAFSMQVLASIPYESHDIGVEFVLTERELIRAVDRRESAK
jgi:5-formyltetrahydrofolate cyclo-ligase